MLQAHRRLQCRRRQSGRECRRVSAAASPRFPLNQKMRESELDSPEVSWKLLSSLLCACGFSLECRLKPVENVCCQCARYLSGDWSVVANGAEVVVRAAIVNSD